MYCDLCVCREAHSIAIPCQNIIAYLFHVKVTAWGSN